MKKLTIRKAKEPDLDEIKEMRYSLQKRNEKANPRVWTIAEGKRDKLHETLLEKSRDASSRIDEVSSPPWI